MPEMIPFKDVPVGKKFHENEMIGGRVPVYTKLDDKSGEDYWKAKKEFGPDTPVMLEIM